MTHPRFGRLVVRAQAKSQVASTVFLGGLMGSMALAALYALQGPERLGGLLPLAAAAYFVKVGLTRSAGEVLVYERGVRVVGDQAHDVSFDEMRTLRCSVEHVLVNGGYNHSVAILKIGRERAPDVVWQRNVKREDEAFAAARDALVAPLAARMTRTLSEGGRVAWVPGISFDGETLHVESGFVGGRAQTRSVPLREVAIALRNGKCELRKGAESIITIDVADANFLPGLVALQSLRKGMVQ